MTEHARLSPVRRLLSAAVITAGLFASAAPVAHARKHSTASTALAATPPLGWNSWDSYGLTITADEFKRNVDWFNEHLKPAGWQYVVVDEGWYLAHPENASVKGADQGYTLDSNGRYIPAERRFPQGLRGLADYAHERGLKFGLHILRGIPKEAVEKNLPIAGTNFHAADAADTSDTCRWNPDNYGIKDNAAGQAYYDSIAQLYAGWGVDFLKVDCIANPYDTHEIHQVSSALSKAGRPTVLSLSPGATPLEDAADVVKEANLWRISGDFWDTWADPKLALGGFPQSLTNQFATLANWAQYAGPGHWPDADMLPIGYLGPRPGYGQPRLSRLTYDETRTLLTLWSIGKSPLILGANLTQFDALLESLVTNPEVLFVDQHSIGNHLLAGVGEAGKSVVWRAEEPDHGKRSFIAVFNLSDQPLQFSWDWKQLGFKGDQHQVRDLWQAEDLGRKMQLAGTIPPHGSALYRVDRGGGGRW